MLFFNLNFYIFFHQKITKQMVQSKNIQKIFTQQTQNKALKSKN